MNGVPISRRTCVLAAPAWGVAALGLPGCAHNEQPGSDTMTQAMRPIAPETVPLGNEADLATLWAAWQGNADALLRHAAASAWDASDCGLDAAMTDAELAAFEREFKLPPQLRWLATRARAWSFGWSGGYIVPDGLGPASVDGADHVWQINQELMAQLQWWTTHHDTLRAGLSADVLGEALSREQWLQHMPFCQLGRGDLLTIDMRSHDPAQQVVRFFCHEQFNGPHEAVLAPDLFSFVSRWSSIGFIEDFEGFIEDAGLAVQSSRATAFRAWLMGPHSAS